MAAYCQVYDSCHLQADWKRTGINPGTLHLAVEYGIPFCSLWQDFKWHSMLARSLCGNWAFFLVVVADVQLVQASDEFGRCVVHRHQMKWSPSSLIIHGPWWTVSIQVSCWLAQMGFHPVNFLWLWPATDHEPHCRHVPINKIWRRTESTPRSAWWRSHVAGIHSDGITREINRRDLVWSVCCRLLSNLTYLSVGENNLSYLPKEVGQFNQW